jgi:hypothetical protein
MYDKEALAKHEHAIGSNPLPQQICFGASYGMR